APTSLPTLSYDTHSSLFPIALTLFLPLSLSLPPPITISLPNTNLNTNKLISVLQHICRSHDRLAEICHVERVVEEVATTLGLKEGGWRWARRPKDTIGGVQEVVDLVQRL
ncbi:hypothetical protein V8G54_007897, partial [Vigna mungo]